ncbi:MAG: heavy metal-associated domain-containing protein [Candidatus Nanohaloarchaea archaeon]|nr:heavy metal-associated domain-containing protein [Candidatus Nanohaloarchaea archaeon]
MMETTVRIDDMHCASCASGIEVFLESQDGITSADVDYDDKQAHIDYTEDADLAACWERLKDMGYEVETDDG